MASLSPSLFVEVRRFTVSMNGTEIYSGMSRRNNVSKQNEIFSTLFYLSYQIFDYDIEN
jgi:hypothetical protein